MAIDQMQLWLPESASKSIEDLLGAVCPVHIGTTLSASGQCAMCEVQASAKRRRAAEVDAYYDSISGIGTHPDRFAR